MFLELVATAFAGIAAAGIVLILNKILGGRLPKWLMPIVAGLGMIGTTIANEYGWYGRTLATLPEGIVVAKAYENVSFYRPWTYAKPYVDQFAALDTATVRTNDKVPGQHMQDLLLFGRWSAVQKVPMLFDCTNNRQAALIDGMSFDETGNLVGGEWRAALSDDPVHTMACEGV